MLHSSKYERVLEPSEGEGNDTRITISPLRGRGHKQSKRISMQQQQQHWYQEYENIDLWQKYNHYQQSELIVQQELYKSGNECIKGKAQTSETQNTKRRGTDQSLTNTSLPMKTGKKVCPAMESEEETMCCWLCLRVTDETINLRLLQMFHFLQIYTIPCLSLKTLNANQLER